MHSLVVADIEEFENGQEPARNEEASYVYGIGADALPRELAASLKAAAPNYEPTYSKTTGETTWANVCVHCGALQGAFFLHNEPDGPFFGGPSGSSAPRRLLSSEPFNVDDADYSL